MLHWELKVASWIIIPFALKPIIHRFEYYTQHTHAARVYFRFWHHMFDLATSIKCGLDHIAPPPPTPPQRLIGYFSNFALVIKTNLSCTGHQNQQISPQIPLSSQTTQFKPPSIHKKRKETTAQSVPGLPRVPKGLPGFNIQMVRTSPSSTQKMTLELACVVLACEAAHAQPHSNTYVINILSL